MYMAKTPKRPRDPNQLAKFIMDIAVGDSDDSFEKDEKKSEAGKKGAEARKKSLSAEKRKEISKTAALSRWNKDKDTK